MRFKVKGKSLSHRKYPTRGLASTSKETRLRVASMGGIAKSKAFKKRRGIQ